MSEPCLLALDAASDRLCIAVAAGGRVALRELAPARAHTSAVFRLACDTLQEAGAGIADLDAVAFGCGPGSFTGVRVVAAAAQAIGFARDIPVCRVSSLRLLAASAKHPVGTGAIGVCVDARMGRVYAGLYTAGGERCGDEVWAEPSALQWPGVEPFMAVGDGWGAWPALLARFAPRIAAVDVSLLPAARRLLDLAREEYRAGRGVAAAAALPEYLGQMPAQPAHIAR